MSVTKQAVLSFFLRERVSRMFGIGVQVREQQMCAEQVAM